MADDELVDAWCVQWQTDRMSAPAFWYYGHEQLARDAYVYFQHRQQHVEPPRRCQVPRRALMDRLELNAKSSTAAS